MPDKTMQPACTTRPLTAESWGDFAGLVEADNGVWGGCWCAGLHPEGVGKGRAVSQKREAKQAHVRKGTVRQVLVYDGGDCAGWCQYGPPAELPAIRNPKARNAGLTELPDWRIGCIFTGKGHRRTGIARAAVAGALAAIREAGGGLVEAYPRAGRGSGTPARRLLPHRPGELVRGVRIRARPADRQVALGDAPARSALIAAENARLPAVAR